jgi:hypothetical protein
VWGLPRRRDEYNLCDFPLSCKVTVGQHSIEERGEILKANGGQLFERPAGDEVVIRGFISRRLVIIGFTSASLKRVTGGSSWYGVSRSDVMVTSGVDLGSQGCSWNTEAR